MHVCVCVCACMHACMFVCVHLHVCVCVCVLDVEGSRAFTSTALVTVQTVVYLTAYSDCLTDFSEPLSPPNKHHTGLKNV